MASLLIDDFSGGLNLRDSPNEIAPNETPLATNWTLDTRGQLTWRNGCTNATTLPGTAASTNSTIFYSTALNLWLCARPSAGTLHLFSAPGTAMTPWTDRGTINSDISAQAGFIDFPGFPPKVVIATDLITGGTKGIWTFDGTFALTNVSTTVAGSAIALWQDKAWVCGYPVSDANGNPTRLFYCLAKDPTAWNATTQFIDVREKDAAPLVALGVASGALISFKQRSTYRHNDSSTGEFAMLDTGIGATGARSVVAHLGRLFAWGPIGLYECDGIGRLRNVGDKLRPLYSTVSQTSTISVFGGVFGQRLLWSVFTAAERTLYEFNPVDGWLVQHQLGGSAPILSSFAAKDNNLYAAASSTDKVLLMFDSAAAIGTDDGSLAAANWVTPWFLPNSGMLSRLHRMRVQGRITEGTSSTLSVDIRKDWDTDAALTFQIESLLRASDSTVQQLFADLQSLGHSAAFAFRFTTGSVGGATSIRAIQLVDRPLQFPNPGYPRGQRATDSPPPVPAQ